MIQEEIKTNGHLNQLPQVHYRLVSPANSFLGIEVEPPSPRIQDRARGEERGVGKLKLRGLLPDETENLFLVRGDHF